MISAADALTQTNVRKMQIAADRKDAQEKDRQAREFFVQQKLAKVMVELDDLIMDYVGRGETYVEFRPNSGLFDVYDTAFIKLKYLGYQIESASINGYTRISWG